MQVLRSTMVKVQCLCVLWFSRYSHFSEHLPLNVMLLRNTMLHWTGSGRTAVSHEPYNVQTPDANVREAPNLERTVRGLGIHTIDGGSRPLPVWHVFRASASDYSWWSIIDRLLYMLDHHVTLVLHTNIGYPLEFKFKFKFK